MQKNGEFRRRSESGQAIIELTVMLIALVAVILGVVFVAGLAVTDNKVLLEAKRNAEYAARILRAEPQLNAWEHASWEYGSFAFSPTSKASIPFSALDRPVRTDINSLQNAPWQLRTPIYSESNRYYYEWRAPEDFDAGAFRGDSSASLGNALDAAALVAATSASNDPASGFDDGYRDGAAAAMRNAFFTWFGVKIDEDTLRRSLPNTVYMPTGEIAR